MITAQQKKGKKLNIDARKCKKLESAELIFRGRVMPNAKKMTKIYM
jgi:hypothetical protein